MNTARQNGSDTQRSDAELVATVRRGDKQAFVEIVSRHQAMVCGIAFGILGDFAASEDAGQDAFLTAWRKFSELRDPNKLRPWLAQIARNAALGQLRRKRGCADMEEAMLLADESPRPDEAAASEEESALVRESLAKLPETYRLPLILFYREGQSVRAVAEALDLTEDAVKQRLARGREMLQQRMSGVIETVLTRTKPNAIFTMGIAVAIGALAAPAAVAGGVFAAASASGAATSTATASTKSLFAAMSTTKGFLVASALVAVVCIPIGYHLPTRSTPDVATNGRPQMVAQKPAAPEVRKPTFEDSGLFAEWRQLHEQYGTNGQAMPLIYKAITGLKDSVRRQAFRAALISEWAQVDPAGGLAFFLGKGPDDTQRRQFFEEWMARDGRGMVEAILAREGSLEHFPTECLPQLARLAPARLPELVSRLPKPDGYWDTGIRDAFAILAEGDVGAAGKAALAVTGPNRDEALAGVAKAWAKNDLNGAVAWAKTLPSGTDRDEIIRAAIIARAGVDPVSALELVEIVPAGGRHAFFASTTGARVLSTAAAADFEATVSWVASNPGRLSREDLVGLAQSVTERLNSDATGFLNTHASAGSLDALLPAINSALLNEGAGQRAALWDWLKTQSESEATKALKEDVLSSAGYQDPALALKLVADLPRTPEGDAQVQKLAACLYNGGSMLHRFDALVAQAPERLRQPLIENAFTCLRGESLDAPTWIARLSLLPDSSRAKATESLAGAWAFQAPEEALGWANSLPSGETHDKAVAAVAASWARTDAHSVADWIASMAPGSTRDHSAESLVQAVASQYPREAWDWALSIDDPAERKNAAANAAKAMAARDPAIARQWIDGGPFTAETKSELQASLEKGKLAGQ